MQLHLQASGTFVPLACTKGLNLLQFKEKQKCCLFSLKFQAIRDVECAKLYFTYRR